MAIPVYPAGLPLPLRDGYGMDSVNQILSTSMESGRSRQRLAFANVPSLITLRWNLTSPEAALLQAWVVQTVGAGWCYIPLVTPLGFDSLKLRFKESLKGPTLKGRYSWDYSAVCELEETPLLEPGWVDLLPDYILNADIFDKAVNWEKP